MYKVSKIHQTCSACPSQWEGELEDGRGFYIRYRHAMLRVDLEKGPIFLGREYAHFGEGGQTEFHRHLTEYPDIHGTMEFEELQRRLNGFMDFSEAVHES